MTFQQQQWIGKRDCTVKGQPLSVYLLPRCPAGKKQGNCHSGNDDTIMEWSRKSFSLFWLKSKICSDYGNKCYCGLKNVHICVPVLRTEVKGFKPFSQKMEEVSFKRWIYSCWGELNYTPPMRVSMNVLAAFGQTQTVVMRSEAQGLGVRWPVAHQEGHRDFISFHHHERHGCW